MTSDSGNASHPSNASEDTSTMTSSEEVVNPETRNGAGVANSPDAPGDVPQGEPQAVETPQPVETLPKSSESSSSAAPVEMTTSDAPEPACSMPETPVASPQPNPQQSSPLDAPRARQIKIGSQRETPSAAVPSSLEQTTPQGAAPENATSSGAHEEPGGPTNAETASEVSSAPSAEAVPAKAAQPASGPVSIDSLTSPELDREVEATLSGVPIDELIDSSTAQVGEMLPLESNHKGRVVSIAGENVFLDMGVRQQGILPLRQFAEPPKVGDQIDVSVVRFDTEDGLYQLTLPGAVADVADWSHVAEGMVVEARITGTNKGGLECQVRNLRGFIPASQASLYRVENLEQLVGEQFPCVVVEVNPRRRKLVLSRRAFLEREQEAVREKLFAELAVGQVRDGVVRNLRDFGAFIDLGGVDGLLHVSQMSWSRVKHPKDVLEVGQTIQVKVLKINSETKRISLGLKDLIANPWSDAEAKYAPRSSVDGKVTKITDFGAFIELEPGVEGMVHISELAHRHVAKVREVLAEGQDVKAEVLSVDPGKRRIALSIKALEPKSEPTAAATSKPTSKKRKHDPSLKGGLGGPAGGQQFGLKW